MLKLALTGLTIGTPYAQANLMRLQQKLLKNSDTAACKVEICQHCGQPSAAQFCCKGCEAAYGFIQSCELGDFYRLKGLDLLSPVPDQDQSDDSYLDQPEVRAQYLIGPETLEFFVQGLQCAACVWLLEKIPQIASQSVQAVRVDAARNTVVVTLFAQASISEFLRIARRLGYRLRPLRRSDSLIEIRRQEGRREILRLAVGFVAMGNIMLFSAAVYFGAESEVARFFSWLSFALFCPVLTYVAAPLWQATWAALKLRRPSVELPIILALLAGTTLSLISLWNRGSETYFDSMSALIFLLLAGRFLVRRFQDRFYENQTALNRLDIPFARLEPSGSIVPTEAIVPGQMVRVLEGDRIPCDGRVIEGELWVEQSVLTGEPLPCRASFGSLVFAGTRAARGHAVVEVIAPEADSRLSQLQKKATQTALSKAKIRFDLERWSQNFSWIVLSLAFGLVAFAFLSSTPDFYSRALALLLVACPCALALAAPLIYSFALQELGKRSVFLSSADVLEKIPDVKNLVFDKTGTLTYGEMKVVRIEGELSPSLQNMVVALESQSSHPVARTLVRHFGTQGPYPSVSNVQILEGKGIEGSFGEQRLQISKSKSHLPSEGRGTEIWIDIRRNGSLHAQICLADRLRTESRRLIREMADKGFSPWILSGDRQSNVDLVAQALSIPAEQALGDLSPERKLNQVQALSGVMMVGDGFNDSPAVAESLVGVVVGGALEKGLQVGEVFLPGDRISELPKLWKISQQARKSLQRVKSFSITYNLISGSLAVMGFATPLVAAILMPVASVCLVLISVYSMRFQWKS